MHNPVHAGSSQKIKSVNYSRNGDVHAHLQGVGGPRRPARLRRRLNRCDQVRSAALGLPGLADM